MPAKLESVQALRGICATGVLLWHAMIFTGGYEAGVGVAIFRPASIMGVDMFFLICGFVIFVASTKGPINDLVTQNPMQFLVRRTIRIYPLYLICTLVIFFIEFSNERQTLTLLIRSLAFIPTENAAAPNIFQPILSVGWSITYELAFYAVFAAALAFKRDLLRLICFWAAVAILAPAALITNIWLDPASAQSQPFAILTIIGSPLNLLFIIGIFIGVIYRSSFVFPSKTVAAAAIAVSTVACLVQYALHWNITHGMFGVGLPLAALLTALVVTEKTFTISPPRWLVRLGDISYSLYLVHPIAIWISIWINVLFNLGNPVGGWVLVTTTIIVSIIGAYGTYSLIEQKLGRPLTLWANAKVAALQITGAAAIRRSKIT